MRRASEFWAFEADGRAVWDRTFISCEKANQLLAPLDVSEVRALG